MNGNGLFLPSANSTIAPEVDALFNFIVIISSILFAIVAGGSIYFAFRYRRKKLNPDHRPDLSHNTKLEIFWTAIPTILVFIVFFWGFKSFLKMHVAPKDAYQIKATGQKWFWQFDYPNGASNTNDLIVPVGKPVQLLMSSQDVVHSFYVPNFRVKMDVLPNRYTTIWFEATETGDYDLFCAEFCGTGHSKMIGKVKVLPETDFNTWLEQSSNPGEGLSLEEYGAKLYKSKACVTCHSVDGMVQTGPSFKNAFGKTEHLANGQTVTIDENYLRESILSPQSKVVNGFLPVMPTYQGILKDREVDALVTFIKSQTKQAQNE